MKKKIVSLVLVMVMALSSLSAFAEETVDVDLINQMLDIIDNYYNYDIDRETLIQGAYKGILDTMDKHSVYFPEDDYKEFIDTINGEFIGVGIYIEAHEGYIKVLSPIEGMPGDLAGLKSGDLITHVDGKHTKDYMYEIAVNMILGEVDTPVVLTIEREGKSFDVTIIRKVIEVPNVAYEMLDDGVAYLKISTFGASVAKEVNDAMVALSEAGMESIVVDLRNNSGGYLGQVVQIADWFVEEGDPILHVDYGKMTDENYYAQLKALNIPTAVLVNPITASASEILAGAIQYNDEGIVIGQVTYGKGTVQNLMTLKDNSAMKLTTAEYLAAHRKPVNNIGITPDYIIEPKDFSDLNFVTMEAKSLKTLYKEGHDVYGAQQRLDFLGYDVDINGVYDQKTANALFGLQKKYGLKEYALYEETKDKLDALIEDKIQNTDLDLEKALEWIADQG